MLSLAAGGVALLATPREEDPQIVVPVAEIVVARARALRRSRSNGRSRSRSNARARPRRRRTRLLGEPPRRRRRHRALPRRRGPRGQPRQAARRAAAARAPVAVAGAALARRERVDRRRADPGGDAAQCDRSTTTRCAALAEEIAARLQQVDDAGPATLHGGRPRRFRVQVDPGALAGRGLSLADVERALASRHHRGHRRQRPARRRLLDGRSQRHACTTWRRCATRRRRVRRPAGAPRRRRHASSTARPNRQLRAPAPRRPRDDAWRLAAAEAAVTLAVAKRRGANAVATAAALRERLDALRAGLLPADVSMTVTRDSGATAEGKVDELLEGLGRRHRRRRRADHADARLARSDRRRPRGADHVRPLAAGQPPVRLQHQPRHAVRADPGAGPRRRRPDRRRREHPPPPAAPRPAAAAGGARRGRRSAAAGRHADAGGDPQLPAAVLHHRHDGPVHAADGAQRAGGDADEHGGRVHADAVDVAPGAAQGVATGGGRGGPTTPTARAPLVQTLYAAIWRSAAALARAALVGVRRHRRAVRRRRCCSAPRARCR
jgi:hypothetical protein